MKKFKKGQIIRANNKRLKFIINIRKSTYYISNTTGQALIDSSLIDRVNKLVTDIFV